MKKCRMTATDSDSWERAAVRLLRLLLPRRRNGCLCTRCLEEIARRIEKKHKKEE